MTLIAYLLITLSFIAGAFFASLDPRVVNWTHLLICLAPGIVGLVLVRVARHRLASHPERQRTGFEAVHRGLRAALDEAERLWQDRENIGVGDLRNRIDERFIDPINAFIEARETMIDVFGLQGYADVMSEFAAGERYLNRVWSASTDGYIEEAHAYLGQAKLQFAAALEVFEKLGEAAQRLHPSSN